MSYDDITPEKAVKLLTESKLLKLSKEEVFTLQNLAKKIHSLSEAEQIAIDKLLKKAGTLGNVVKSFEAVLGFIATVTFMRNIAWIAAPILILWGLNSEVAQKALDLLFE